MAKATKFSASDLTQKDMKMIQNEIIQRLAIKQGTNLSPHDSHSSSHGKNSVVSKVGNVIRTKGVGK